jgi:hypothetical protein
MGGMSGLKLRVFKGYLEGLLKRVDLSFSGIALRFWDE